MRGYEVVDMYAVTRVGKELLGDLGFDLTREGGRLCSLCPKDARCQDAVDCDLDATHVWVPEHVAAIVKMQGELT